MYLIQNEEIKRQTIPLVLDRLSYCEQLFTVIYENKEKEYIKLDNSYKNDFKSRITNTSELKKMCEIGKALPEYLEIITLCKIARVRLREMSGEYFLAKENVFSLVSFLSEKIDNYKDNFGDYALSIKQIYYESFIGDLRNIGPWDSYQLNKEKIFKNIKDEFLEPHERIEFLLNIALCVPMDVTEELSDK